MRYIFALAAAALWAGCAIAEEAEACYIAKDPTGDFVQDKLQSFDANPGTAAQVTRLVNQNSRATSKCMQRYIEREGGWPNGAGLLYGARISPAGKVTQVSVLGANRVNDSMLMACIGRSICQWELEADVEGKEQLIKLPPYVFKNRTSSTLRAPATY